MSYSVKPPNEDPYFFDHEDLLALAHEQTISRGLAYFKDYRVVEIDQDKEMLWARVEDEDTDIPVGVEIRRGSDGNLLFHCDCDTGQQSVCRHQVATLYAYADQRDETDELLSACFSSVCHRSNF